MGGPYKMTLGNFLTVKPPALPNNDRTDDDHDHVASDDDDSGGDAGVPRESESGENPYDVRDKRCFLEFRLFDAIAAACGTPEGMATCPDIFSRHSFLPTVS